MRSGQTASENGLGAIRLELELWARAAQVFLPVHLFFAFVLVEPSEAVGGDLVDQIFFDGVDVAVMDVGIEIVAFDDDVVSAFNRADVFEVRVALGFGLGAGRFNASLAGDDVIAHDVPLRFVGDEVECFGGLSE